MAVSDIKIDSEIETDTSYQFFNDTVTNSGFRFESYNVTTEDEYILALFRIRNNDETDDT